jgi:dihydrodipicolinate reductase
MTEMTIGIADRVEEEVMSRKHVKITSHDGQVDTHTVRVSKNAGEEVVWFSHANKRAIVAFASADGSPFQETHFHVPAGGSVGSGPAHGAAEKKAYKYTPW